MRESSIERKLVTGVKKAGGIAYKFTSPGHAGVPDRIVLLPCGRVIFIELKTEAGRLSAIQKEQHKQLRALGMDVRTLYGKTDVEGFIRDIQSLGLSEGGLRVDPVAPEVRTVSGNGPWENRYHPDSD